VRTPAGIKVKMKKLYYRTSDIAVQFHPKELAKKIKMKRLSISAAAEKTGIVIAWVVFIGLMIFYIGNVNAISGITDVDDATTAAASGYLNGYNPYDDEAYEGHGIVPRFASCNRTDITDLLRNPENAYDWEWGTYNYLPVDLFVYTFFYSIFSNITIFWYAVANIIMSIAIVLIFKRTFPQAEYKSIIPMFGLIFLLFTLDGVILTMLFFAIAMWFEFKTTYKYKEFIAATFLLLGTLTKVFLIVALVVYLIYYLQKKWSCNQILATTIFCLIAGAFTILIIMPFGINDVLSSTILFHTDPALRTETTLTGGTLLYELAGHSIYFVAIAAALLCITIGATVFINGLTDRMIIASIALMLFIPNCSFSVTIIPMYLLLIYYFKREPDR
jgi:hypothetical protein